MTEETPPDRGIRCHTCNQKPMIERYGRHYKAVCDCGETPIQFGQAKPGEW